MIGSVVEAEAEDVEAVGGPGDGGDRLRADGTVDEVDFAVGGGIGDDGRMLAAVGDGVVGCPGDGGVGGAAGEVDVAHGDAVGGRVGEGAAHAVGFEGFDAPVELVDVVDGEGSACDAGEFAVVAEFGAGLASEGHDACDHVAGVDADEIGVEGIGSTDVPGADDPVWSAAETVVAPLQDGLVDIA